MEIRFKTQCTTDLKMRYAEPPIFFFAWILDNAFKTLNMSLLINKSMFQVLWLPYVVFKEHSQQFPNANVANISRAFSSVWREEWNFSVKGKTRQNEGKNAQKSTRNREFFVIFKKVSVMCASIACIESLPSKNIHKIKGKFKLQSNTQKNYKHHFL